MAFNFQDVKSELSGDGYVYRKLAPVVWFGLVWSENSYFEIDVKEE